VGKHVLRHPRLTVEPAQPVRSSIQDAYSSGVHLIIADNGHTNDDIPLPPSRLRRQKSNPNLSHHVSLKNILLSTENDSADSGTTSPPVNNNTKLASFANLNKSSEKGINLTYTDQEKEDQQLKQSLTTSNRKHSQSNGNGFVEKKTTFATLPNMTTWQQQSNQQNQQIERHSGGSLDVSYHLYFLLHFIIF
jgi:calmodulin-regulated spectrin-associated protein